MGWTSYRATHYTNRGLVNRKAECDAYFEEGLNRGHYKVLKSYMKGRVYYGAIQYLVEYVGKDEKGNNIYKPIENGEVFAVVFLTSVDNKDYFNFSYKDMDETMNPFYYDCPESILKMLSETDNKYALEWRAKCRENNKQKKEGVTLSSLPIGTVIEYKLWNGDIVQAVKHRPAYQFKRAFWMKVDEMKYIPKTRIPKEFTIIKAV